jgi:hypothetical protein
MEVGCFNEIDTEDYRGIWLGDAVQPVPDLDTKYSLNARLYNVTLSG